MSQIDVKASTSSGTLSRLVSLINYVTICLLAIDLIAGAKVIRLMGRAVKVPVMEADKNLQH